MEDLVFSRLPAQLNKYGEPVYYNTPEEMERLRLEALANFKSTSAVWESRRSESKYLVIDDESKTITCAFYCSDGLNITCGHWRPMLDGVELHAVLSRVFIPYSQLDDFKKVVNNTPVQ